MKEINFNVENRDEVFRFIKENTHFCGEHIFQKHFIYIYNMVEKIDFPFEVVKYSQKIYHFFHNDVDEFNLGKCKMCGERCKYISFIHGYSTYCCPKCVGRDEDVINKNRETNIRKYGEDYTYRRCKLAQETIGKHTDEEKQSIINKRKQTKLKKYGDENYNNTKKQQETMVEKYGGVGFSSEQVMKKYKETMRDRYRNENYRNSELGKLTSVEKYGQTHYSKTQTHKENMKKFWGDISEQTRQQFKDKQYLTKKKNNSFHTSSIEDKLYDWFVENNINIIKHYKSELYPYCCDFYLPDYDLYLEIQGTWTHGPHPFDENNPDDLKLMDEWMELSMGSLYYQNAVTNWTQRDVMKRNTAKQNKINYLEVFSDKLDVCTKTINNYINNLQKDVKSK